MKAYEFFKIASEKNEPQDARDYDNIIECLRLAAEGGTYRLQCKRASSVVVKRLRNDGFAVDTSPFSGIMWISFENVKPFSK